MRTGRETVLPWWRDSGHYGTSGASPPSIIVNCRHFLSGYAHALLTDVNLELRPQVKFGPPGNLPVNRRRRS